MICAPTANALAPMNNHIELRDEREGPFLHSVTSFTPLPGS